MLQHYLCNVVKQILNNHFIQNKSSRLVLFIDVYVDCGFRRTYNTYETWNYLSYATHGCWKVDTTFINFNQYYIDNAVVAICLGIHFTLALNEDVKHRQILLALSLYVQM